ncbi:MAG TPA: ScyD/ScyE family protein [Actinomycetota bacterium]|nr:ScyD/ScyE family protein [Actinomycetota bacterium]
MLRSARRAGAVAGLLALAVVTALGGAATAAPSGSKSPSQAMADAAKGSGGSGRLKVVAEGLDNPRGIGFGPDGALYVAESGSGGAGPCVAGPEGADVCFGRSGGVTRITKRSQQRVLSGLPSVAEEGGVAATGPVDLGFSGRSGYLLLGNILDPTTRALFGPGARRLGKLLKVNVHGIRAVADFPRFEVANDPDESAGTGPDTEPGINSNPNGLLVRHRSQVVADAGGNDLLKVDHKGRISVVGVFPTQTVPAPPGFPVPELESQAVPTSVVKGPDGAFYVGQLTGFPFPVGGASVFRVVPGHDPEVFAGGFTNIIDIAFDKRGRLYVLEIATGGLLNTPPDQLPAGRLVRVNRDGSQTTLASEGLSAPGGFVLGHGAAYITNNSILSDAGQVVKVAI